MAATSFFTIVCNLSILLCLVASDTPANCSYDEIVGKWIFSEGERESDSKINCTGFTGDSPAHVLYFTLRFPNVAFDENGHKGYWTIVYNQGFEVVINHRKYFAFSLYKKDAGGNTTTSICDRTLPGWSHDVLGHNWACYVGHKTSALSQSYTSDLVRFELPSLERLNGLVEKINGVQDSWTAIARPELEGMAVQDLVRRSGGLSSRVFNPPPPRASGHVLSKVASSLPEEFDWRNVKGVNFVSPVRNQGSCGSCYAFSSLAMLESRLRVMTNNSLKVQFSPQDVVSCSEYAQGCEGGFPYVIAGKYAQDFGVLPEECFPYEGKDAGCTAKLCKRYYVAHYNYVGGFFGGCNEDLMKLDIVKNGPVTVAFEVYPDFQLYSSGIYHHTGVGDGFNPFHLVNHGVLITGYGRDGQTGEKFWIVKNSWGESWGEQGYFRIRRGTNECNIESMAVSAIPIP